MSKIRSKEQHNKVSGKTNGSQGCCAEQYPWFSFKNITKNSNYNLDMLSSGTEREQTLLGLYTRLNELSDMPWLYWMQQPKKTGLETLSYHEIKFKANPNIELAKDTTLYIFRFDTYRGQGQGRIIGFKNAPCSVLHIIGYDLDFSAYNHGK